MAKKRANGEGNIRKRKDGRWEGRYTAGVDPETGKPIAKSVLARTQRECKEKLQKAMEELEKIDVTKRRDYTVGEWAQLWYENYAKPSVRASTAAYYKNYIDQHGIWQSNDVYFVVIYYAIPAYYPELELQIVFLSGFNANHLYKAKSRKAWIIHRCLAVLCLSQSIPRYLPALVF